MKSEFLLPRQEARRVCWHRTAKHRLPGSLFPKMGSFLVIHMTHFGCGCLLNFLFGPESANQSKPLTGKATVTLFFPFWFSSCAHSPYEMQRMAEEETHTPLRKVVTTVSGPQRRCHLHPVKSEHSLGELQAEVHLLLPASRCQLNSRNCWVVFLAYSEYI